MSQPRVYISAKDEDALRIYSQTTQTNIALSNVAGTFFIGSSNNRFIVYQDSASNTLIDGYYDPVTGAARLNTGEIHLSGTRRRVIFDDLNDLSAHQFAGLGFDDASNVAYQVTRTGQKHVFYKSETAFDSTPLMTIGADSIGNASVIIGPVPQEPTAALHVSGNTVITGDLAVNGNFAFNNSNIILADPETGQVPPAQLPSGIVYVSQSNLIDSSLLPREYTFQYLRGQQNVGIGTRTAAQKLHVIGSAIISDRLGIGSNLTQPAARIHIRENQYTSIPTILIENPMGSPTINIQSANGESSFAIPGTRKGVAIGTDVFTGPVNTTLEVLGDTYFRGSTTVSGTTKIHGDLEIPSALYYDSYSNIRVYAPANFHGPLAASNITTVGEAGYVRFQNTGINVDGDLYLGGQLYILSDRNHKTNIEPLNGALDRISNIRGYKYTLKQTGRSQVGLMADEVDQVLPEAVGHFPHASDIRAVNYDSIIPLLVESIHELKNEIAALKHKYDIPDI